MARSHDKKTSALQLRLSPDLHFRLKAQAWAEHRSVSALLCWLISSYLDAADLMAASSGKEVMNDEEKDTSRA